MPSMRPRTVSLTLVMPVPGTNSTSAVVFSSSTLWPALVRPLENAIEKQAAWAAASSSLGLVFPCWLSARLAHETGNSSNAPLAAFTWPLPWRRSPFQTASARLIAAIRISPCLSPAEGTCRRPRCPHMIEAGLCLRLVAEVVHERGPLIHRASSLIAFEPDQVVGQKERSLSPI